MKVIEFESHFNTAFKKKTHKKTLNKFPQHYDVNQPSQKYRIKLKVLMFNGMA